MGLFENFPYTNFHEMNLDWLLAKMKKAEENADKNAQDITAINNEITSVNKAISSNSVDIASNTNRISTLEQTGTRVPPDAVNVKKFGAVGDAKYYDLESNTYYADSNKTACHDDTEAIDAAMTYALQNNIDTLFFPDGAYMYTGTITIDISKLRIVGENNSSIVSAGLTSGAFITLTGPLDLTQYNYSKTVLENINIWGAYYNGATIAPVTGILFSGEFVPCHAAFNNVSIVHFDTGINAGEIYKTVFNNISVIACNIGLNISNGTAVPVYFTNCYFECCNLAFYCDIGGYTQLNFTACAFEYNRRIMNCNIFVNFTACRFEYDRLSAIDPDTNATQLVFSFNQSNSANNICFTDCQFLDLQNYADNVRFWIRNPVVNVNRQGETMYYNSNIKAGVFMTNCSFALAENSDGNYYITGTGVVLENCKVTGKTSNEFINPSTLTATATIFYD